MEAFGIRDIYMISATSCSRRVRGLAAPDAASVPKLPRAALPALAVLQTAKLKLRSGKQTCKRSFQPMALRNRLAACQARGTCKQCHAILGRGEFWPGDWPNRHKYGIKCTTCEPRGARTAGEDMPSRESTRTPSVGSMTQGPKHWRHRHSHAANAMPRNPSDGFWPHDFGCRNRNPLHCKTCQPVPPDSRRAAKAAREHVCSVCNTPKMRDCFWDQDRYSSKHSNRGLVCKTCKPTPPGQRQRGRLARASSAGPSV